MSHPLAYGSRDGPKADKESWAFKWAEQYRAAQREARQLFREHMRWIEHAPHCPMRPDQEAGYGKCVCGLVGLIRRNW